MTLLPHSFAGSTSSIPLSYLDDNFNNLNAGKVACVGGLSAADSGVSNAALINAALTQRGAVRIVNDGTNPKYLLAAALVLPSYTMLVIDPGVELCHATGAAHNVLTNFNANQAPQAVSSIALAAVTVPNGYKMAATVTFSAAPTGFVVGDFIELQGDPNAKFIGIFKVSAVNASLNTVTLYLSQGYDTLPQTITASMTAKPADGIITVTGGGRISGNATNGGLTRTNNYNEHAIVFNNVTGLLIDGLEGWDTLEYFICGANLQSPVIRNIHGDVPKDGIHIYGPCWGNVEIDGVTGVFGDDGSYDAVRRYAKVWRRERGATTAQAYVPLSFAPGEAYQFDWSHEIVLINGATVTVKVAHVRLCHSRMLFVRAYPRETQEMVFDAHDRAFAFFKGTCTRGIYDNMKTAVDTIFVGKERLYNRRFQQMCGHYLIEPVACTPASGWEKGQVENQVGLVRERFFTPRLRFKTYEELNAWLLDQCIAYAKAHRHPEERERTIWQAFEAERPSLVPYAGRFDGFHAVLASVSKTCLVRFDNNKYSVTASAIGRPVEIRAYADRIELRQDGRPVGEHARCFGRDQTLFNPWHYVPVLARKPGALRNGAPFKDWVLPASLARVWRKLAAMDDGDRQMVEILTSVLSDGLVAVEAACAEALSQGVHSAAVILNILARRREPTTPITIMTPEALKLKYAPTADCARYDSLRRVV